MNLLERVPQGEVVAIAWSLLPGIVLSVRGESIASGSSSMNEAMT